MEKLKKDLFESNKRLKAARAVEDPKLESNLLRKIKRSEVKLAVLKIHEVWKRSGKKLTMKECAIKVTGE